MTHFLYFAYGSNMLTERLQKRCPSARSVGVARLAGYALKFSKISNDGSGKATIVPSENSEVYGVIFKIKEEHRKCLDRAEGALGAQRGYEPIENIKPQCLETGEQIEGVRTYIAIESKMDSKLPPYCWYRELVLAGAKQHGLPEDYQKLIRDITCIPDTCLSLFHERREKALKGQEEALKVLKEAGVCLIDLANP